MTEPDTLHHKLSRIRDQLFLVDNYILKHSSGIHHHYIFNKFDGLWVIWRALRGTYISKLWLKQTARLNTSSIWSMTFNYQIDHLIHLNKQSRKHGQLVVRKTKSRTRSHRKPSSRPVFIAQRSVHLKKSKCSSCLSKSSIYMW